MHGFWKSIENGIQFESKRQNLNRHIFTKFDSQLTIGKETFAILTSPQSPGLFAGELECQAPSIEFLSNNKHKEK